MTSAILEVENLSKRFGGFVALDDINLCVAAGEAPPQPVFNRETRVLIWVKRARSRPPIADAFQLYVSAIDRGICPRRRYI